MLALACVGGEDRRAGKAEQMIFLERLYDFSVHISELAAVALVEDDNAMLVEYLVSLVLAHEVVQLLNSRDDDLVFVETAFFVSVLELSLQNSCGGVAIGRAFFKAVVFFHGLIVKVFSIDYEQNLIHIGERRCKLCGLKGGQRFAASRGVPDVTACIHRAHLLVIGRNFDAVENTLGSRNLIGAHDHQNFFRGKYAILGQHVQNGVLGKERLGKVNEVCNYLVVAVCPEGSKLKAVACFLRFLFCGFAHFLDVAVSGGVGIILGMRTVGDNENLNVLI